MPSGEGSRTIMLFEGQFCTTKMQDYGLRRHIFVRIGWATGRFWKKEWFQGLG
jgi:hypothetical protein